MTILRLICYARIFCDYSAKSLYISNFWSLCRPSALRVLASCLLLKDPTHASFFKQGVAQSMGAIGSRAGVGWPKKRAQNKPAMRGIFSGSSRVTALFGFACPIFFRFSSNSSTASVLQHRSISTAALLQLCSSTPQQLHRSSTEAPQQLYSSPRALLYNTAAAGPQQVYSGSTATLQ